MRIVEQKHTIISDISEGGVRELQTIELAGRNAYKSENTDGDFNKTKLFVRGLIKRGHESVLEHSYLTVMFTTDRGVTHELVRHRLASFTQESTRYCNYAHGKFGGEITVVKPVDISEKDPAYQFFISSCRESEYMYMSMLRAGCTPQQARCVLPTATKADITVTANYREWRHILKLRTASDAHPQIRALMLPLLHELQDRIPVIFDDIGEEQR